MRELGREIRLEKVCVRLRDVSDAAELMHLGLARSR